MDLSIIIVNWNTRELLARCLNSIYRFSPDAAFEVFVVDNASADGSADMVRQCFPQVRLIANAENIGFARANNQGIRESSGQFILLLNSDTCLHPEALNRLLVYMQAHPRTGIAGARLLNGDGSVQHYATDFPSLLNQTMLLLPLPGRQRALVGKTSSSIACNVQRVKGAFLGIRRAALDGSGLMNESLFLYAEEDDLCYRVREAGWQVAFLPEVQVTHYGGASTEQVAESALIHLYRGKVWFLRKYRGPWEARAFKAVLIVSCVARMCAGAWGKLFGDATSPARGRAYGRLLSSLSSL